MKKIFNNKLHIINNTGFTLVELVVSMTLTAIFATAIVAIMPSATRIYMNVENTSRAQIVADMVVDALREECADTYIEDYASVRILNVADNGALALGGHSIIQATSGASFNLGPNSSSDTGNVLLMRKTGGYCEALYSDILITNDNKDNVKSQDKHLNDTMPYSSRAVYRLFDVSDNGSEETLRGYVHYGFFESAFKDSDPLRTVPTDSSTATEIVSCFIPSKQYDYTTPFPADAYNGYTVNISFSDIAYTYNNPDTVTLAALPDSQGFNTLYARPSSVCVTVRVYRSDYAGQSDQKNLLYTRTARLVFAEDTTD